MGVVYRARQSLLKRLVALKTIRPGLGSEDLRVRFRAEAEAVARLRHPHIVQVHDVGEWPAEDGSPPVLYLALEFVPGGGLNQALRGTTLPPRAAARLVETLARAMNSAHELNLVHRDLKPANILLEDPSLPPEQWSPKVSDFGLAKFLDADAPDMTRADAILGTPSYMAPEQALGHAASVGRAADIYALGAVLYECLTGRPPFKAASTLETLELVRFQEPVPVRQLQPKAPRDLETICLKCLHKDPGKRYASAEALADDLRRFLEGKPIVARAVGRVERSLKWARRRPAVAALLGGGIVALVLSTALWLRAEDAVGAKEVALHQEQAAKGEADRKRVAAEEATRAEEIAKTEAQNKHKIAEKAREDEANARRDEEKARIKAEQKERETKNVLYFRSILLTLREWAEGNVPKAEHLLADAPEELRGWEWHYANGLCNSALLTISRYDSVWQVTWSPDGNTLAVAGMIRGMADGKPTFKQEVGIWDVRTGKEVRTLSGYTRPLTFSPDGRTLAVTRPPANPRTGQDELRLIDPKTGEELVPLQGSAGSTGCLSFSADGKQLTSAGFGGQVRVWDTATGGEVRRVAVKAQGMFRQQFALSADGTRFVAPVNTINGVSAWDLETGKALWTAPVSTSLNGTAAISPDRSRVVLFEDGGFLRVREMATGRVLCTLTGHNTNVYGLAFSPDGARIAALGVGNTFRVWDSTSGKELMNLRGHVHQSDISHFEHPTVVFSPDGFQVAVAEKKQVRVWDCAGEQEARTLALPVGMKFPSPFTARGRLLVAATTDELAPDRRHVVALDARSGHKVSAITLKERPTTSLVLSPDERFVASGGLENRFQVWETATGKILLTLPDTTAEACSRDSSRVAAGGADGSTKVFNASGGPPLREFPGTGEKVAVLALSPDASRLAVGTAKGTVRLLDLAGENAREWAVGAPVIRLAFDAAGRHVVAVGEKGLVTSWDVTDGTELASFQIPEGFAYREVAVSADGRLVLAARVKADEKDITALHEIEAGAWEAGTGRRVLTLSCRDAQVHRFCFSPDGRRFVYGSGLTQPVLKMLDLATGQESLTLRPTQGMLLGLGFSEDGQLLVATHITGGVTVWSAATQTEEAAVGRREAVKAAIPDRHLWEAQRLLAERQWAAADFHLARLVEVRPAEGIWHAQRGVVAAELGRWEAATDAFARSVDLGFAPDRVRRGLALAALANGKTEAYRSACEPLLKEAKTTRQVPVAIAFLWVTVLAPGGVEKPEEAVAIADKLVDPLQRTSPAHLVLGTALYRAGQYADAEKKLRQALKMYPEDGSPETLFLLAMTEHRLGQTKEARDTRARAVASTKRAESAPDAPARGVPWEVALQRRLLRQEAEKLLQAEDPKP